MKRIIKFISLQAILVFGTLWADTPKTEPGQVFPVNLSVYEGYGSLLLDWSFPDSIMVGATRIFVQKSGEVEFSLLTEIDLVNQRYLDQDCEANSRYFYLVEIEDIFGNIFSSDSETPVFGTCLAVEDSSRYDQSVSSMNGLVLKQIQGKLIEIAPYTDYTNMINLIELQNSSENIWIENYPISELNDAEDMIKTLSSVIMDSEILEDILDTEPVYRNSLFMTPDEWHPLSEQALSTVQENWQLLTNGYPKAMALIDNMIPIRIIGYTQLQESQKELYLYRFHSDQLDLSETFLLSGQEYIDLGQFYFEGNALISVDIPEHWEYVDLIMDDILIQSCFLKLKPSVSFTLNGDIVPSDEPSRLMVNKNYSSLWVNELIWNPTMSQLHLEVAGNPEYDEYFSFYIEDQPIWDIELLSGFETQFLDSMITFKTGINYPIHVSFEKQIDDQRESLEFIVLDTIPLLIHRYPDGGPWHNMEFSTLGISNDPVSDDYDAELLPALFVLYQNYPNPFNGLTRITFDLLDDAVISLYVTDATGRIHDKFVEDQYTNSGTYHYEWNGEGKSTGIYFFTIQAQVGSMAPAIMSRKMIYLK